MTDNEIKRAWELVNKCGPSNCWTGTAGTLAAALGRALKEIQALKEELSMVQPPHNNVGDKFPQ